MCGICINTLFRHIAPDATPTHWKQTMIPFWNSNINVKKGDSLFGIFNLQINKHNKVI